MRARFLVGPILMGILLLGLGLVLHLKAGQVHPVSQTSGTASSLPGPLAVMTGTDSCSGRGCHGSFEPRRNNSGVQQNEYLTWLNQDRHALAYQVLFNQRSLDMVAKLGMKDESGKIIPAHENVRCLACHTNPLVAETNKDSTAASFIAQERSTGVGCESCHGPAHGWLKDHTVPTYRKKPEEQLKANMVPQWSLASYAERCAGCHIGSPAMKEAVIQIPVRDMNHDFIAAGHPRLNFEFSVFLANIPPHWSKTDEEQRPAEAQVWAVGQIESARAALELLADQAAPMEKAAGPRPWPEFAEYDCFACHHELPGAKWPADWRHTKEHYAGRVPGTLHVPRVPGTLPWGSWYFSMPHLLASQASFADPTLAKELTTIKEEMQLPTQDRTKVAEQARATAKAMHAWRNSAANKIDAADLKRLIQTDRVQALARNSWDDAMQVYLAVSALDPQARTLLDEWNKALAFPPGKEGGRNDSPAGFDPTKLPDLKR
jgi:hypothetical protein